MVLDAPKSIIVEGTESSTSATETAPPPKRVVVGDGGEQVNLQKMMGELNTKENVTDDFVAAFLQAGIAVNKLDHPLIRALMSKYTIPFMVLSGKDRRCIGMCTVSVTSTLVPFVK